MIPKSICKISYWNKYKKKSPGINIENIMSIPREFVQSKYFIFDRMAVINKTIWIITGLHVPGKLSLINVTINAIEIIE